MNPNEFHQQQHQHQRQQQQQSHPLLHHQLLSNNRSASSRRNQAQISAHHQQQQQQDVHYQQHKQQPLNGKDLIIRMLAEVFQVNQTSEGQVRWEQVSTSLVPVSLYSRTTSKWLNYLLSSSSSAMARNATNNTANAMSPDSREFLFLLQQFHQQNKPPSQQAQQQHQNVIVFQVVAHDFLNGHCRKILNVKLAQPGTRLGQASDYFIYWKEQNTTNSAAQHNHAQLAHNLMSSSSFASNNPLGRQLIHNNTIQQQQSFSGYSPRFDQNNNPIMCCSRSNTNGESSSQTWGLNFASINDAKLFHDICSLNLVDLDFNSNYLKQLAMKDKNFDMFVNPSSQQFSLAHPLNVNPRKHLQQYQQSIESQNNMTGDCHKEQRNQQHQYLSAQPSFSNENSHLIERQLSTSKCPSCKHLNQYSINSQRSIECSLDASRLYEKSNNSCPVHSLAQHQDEGINQSSRLQQRTRSRSTTRQPSKVTVNIEENSSFKRARSFSTPASPDHPEFDDQHEHHPRCLSFIKKQQKGRSSQQQNQKENEKPQKPIRGVLREHALTSAFRGEQDSLVLAGHLLNSVNHPTNVKRASKATYSDHQQINTKDKTQMLNCSNKRQQNQHFKESNSQELEDNTTTHAQSMCGSKHTLDNSNMINYKQQLVDFEMKKFATSQSAQRRSTGVESENIDHFDPFSHRDASLARAQYANSKNMKEFLSLDAGGAQSTPTQLASLNRRFQQQKKTKPVETDSVQVNIRRNPKTASKEMLSKHTSSSDCSQKFGSYDKSNQQLADSNRKTSKNSSSVQEKTGTQSDMDKTAGECLEDIEDIPEKIQKNNVSTTTDDLPLDAMTRKRMFKLTSEEVISEKTEPKSSCSVGLRNEQIIDQSCDQQASESYIEDRQERAVSLGPEVERSIRGRDARSDTGRRRSLERSMCVDLDSTPKLTYNSIPQSDRIIDLPGRRLPSSNTSAHSVNQQHGNLGFNKELHMDEKERHAHFSCTLKRARTKSSSSSRAGFSCHDNQFYSNHDHQEKLDSLCPQHHMESNVDHLMSFKSAPDISQLCQQGDHNSRAYSNRSQARELSTETRNNRAINHDSSRILNASIGIQPKTANSLSSYAVPLCSDEKGREYGSYSRQFHSCPNSMRRKRKNPHFHENPFGIGKVVPPLHNIVGRTCQVCCDPCENLDFSARNLHYHQAPAVHGNAFLQNEYRGVEANCSSCQNSVEQNLMRIGSGANADFNLFNNKCECVGCNFEAPEATTATNLAPLCGSKSCLKQQQQHHCHQHYRQPCITDMLTESPKRYDSRECHPTSSARSECSHPTASLQYRPYSSQSSRSPLRYGLYESDEEEAQYPPHDQTDSNFIQCALSRDVNSNKASHSYVHNLNSALHKPVEGYDQTMARASLRSRQRAKSQPPIEDKVEKDAEHLNQSMRNLEKLITEVQSELNSLKRRPLSFTQSSDGTTTKAMAKFCTIQPVKLQASTRDCLACSPAASHQVLAHQDKSIKKPNAASTNAFNLKINVWM